MDGYLWFLGRVRGRIVNRMGGGCRIRLFRCMVAPVVLAGFEIRRRFPGGAGSKEN